MKPNKKLKLNILKGVKRINISKPTVQNHTDKITNGFLKGDFDSNRKRLLNRTLQPVKINPHQKSTDRGGSTGRNPNHMLNRTHVSSIGERNLPKIDKRPMSFSPPTGLFSDTRLSNNINELICKHKSKRRRQVRSIFLTHTASDE